MVFVTLRLFPLVILVVTLTKVFDRLVWRKVWLIHTGCGHDLIGKNEDHSSSGVRRVASGAVTCNTANGTTTASEQAVYRSAGLHEEVHAYVLDSIPAVLSAGG